MKKLRIIARLDVKGPNVVKGIHFEGLRVVGNPAKLAKKYYGHGADEILYIDIVASLYERNSLLDVVKESTSLGVFIPMTVGGGIRTLDDIRKMLRAGADKVTINTAAIKNPDFITQASEKFGSQCIVGSIEAKRKGDSWEAYFDNGRERTNLDAIEWAKKLVELGAGEILITSIDREGTKEGFEIDLVKKVVDAVDVPVIAGGGAGSIDDIYNCFNDTGCSAVGIASMIHYNEKKISEIKSSLVLKGLYGIRENKFLKKNKLSSVKINSVGKQTVSIIDYGMGNMHSVKSVLKFFGCDYKLVSTPGELFKSQKLILPGVGAFEEGMNGLEERNLVGALKEYVSENKPLLGICLGMQLFLSESEEFGIHKGLGLIDGAVKKLSPEKGFRLPHIGWNELTEPALGKWSGTILEGLSDNNLFYFVHSFACVPNDITSVLAFSKYGGQSFCSAVIKGNIVGTQFHPEKSGNIGLRVFKNFLKI